MKHHTSDPGCKFLAPVNSGLLNSETSKLSKTKLRVFHATERQKDRKRNCAILENEKS